MEKISQILTQLGINSTIGTQFVVVIALYLISRFAFFKRLQEVIELRILKTKKAEDSAHELIEKFETLKEAFEQKVDSTYKEVQETKNNEKKNIDQQLAQVYKTNEGEVNAYVESSKAEVMKELEKQREAVLGQTDAFAKQLIEKIKA